ncbi:DUF2764 family protein [bacterium]|nr:DUF2764 family protein [bacterium]
MSYYYYLISSLPSLRFGTTPPMRSAAFVALCGEWLPAAEAAELASAGAGVAVRATHPDLRAWLAWDAGLRNGLAAARAQRLGRDATPYLQAEDAPAQEMAALLQEQVRLDDPVAAEQAIDALRWRFLEDMAARAQFAFNVALSYLLRLRILERWAALDEEQGAATLARAVEVKEAA